jgi:hypothetical protein
VRAAPAIVAVAAVLATAALEARAGTSSFDHWLRNPYPVATGFSFPVGDGEGGGAYTDAAGKKYTGWYVATHMGDEYALGIHTGGGLERPRRRRHRLRAACHGDRHRQGGGGRGSFPTPGAAS